MSVIVSDTSPLHYLIICEAQEVLPHLFNQVFIPPTVWAELQRANAPEAVRSWLETAPSWLVVKSPSKLDRSLNVDQGEMEAICLARELSAVAVLMDDLKGRNAALRCGLRVIGTIGLLEAAAGRGDLDFSAAIEKLQRTNARLDPKLVADALERAKRR